MNDLKVRIACQGGSKCFVLNIMESISQQSIISARISNCT